MNSNFIKKIFPYIICFVAFVAIAYAYVPGVFSGKVVNQSDISSWQGMSNEIVSFNKQHPDDRTLWTNSMFSGMPATSISVVYKGDYTQNIYNAFFTGARPASYLLISLVGGFLLMLAFGVNYWLAFLGAIAITFCSYNMQIIQVGHNSKMAAIAFMPWVLASVVYAYRKCGAWGALFFAFALSFQIKANHPQITYYLAIIILGYGIWQFCAAIKDKVLPRFIKVSLMLLVGGMLGIATNVNHLWPTYEYAQHTMRGGSELANANGDEASNAGNANENKAVHKTRKGLDLNYATQWSYGIEETANLLIPNFNGGASAGSLGPKTETYKFLRNNGYDVRAAQQLPLYWGPQPFTAGPMYLGAITIFLFVLGFFVLKGGLKWWVGGVSLLALLLGWGYHFMPASELFFNYAPMYNKFRTVSMILTILQIVVPVLAVLAVNEVLNCKDSLPDKKQIKKGLVWAGGITAGFCLLFALLPQLAGNFISQSDGQLPQQLIGPLVQDRMGLLRADAIRSFVFIAAAAFVLWLGFIKKLKSSHASIILILLVLVDLWSVDKRYLNDSHFVTNREFTNVFTPRAVDNMILQDKDPDYRVLDLSVNTFNDAYVSYHHKTIGGYSPAKLQRYQDLIERNISSEIGMIGNELSGAKTVEDAQNALGYHPVLSMLNTKYIILGENIPPIQNTHRLGNAWFVDSAMFVTSAPAEIDGLSKINPATTAVINTLQFSNAQSSLKSIVNVAADTLGIDNDSIELTLYMPNKLAYKYFTHSPKLALFSEVYYNPGWRAWLTDENGNKKDELQIYQANWILRGVIIPEGSGSILFEFEPPCFAKGEVWSRIASGLLIILLIGGIAFMFVKSRRNKSM